VVNGASFTALHVILDKAYPGHRVSANTILLVGKTTRDLRFVDMPPGTILLTPISTKIECQRKRPWQQNDVTRRGLPCAAAFAYTDYKVQSRTLDRVALELRGAKTAKIKGEAVVAGLCLAKLDECGGSFKGVGHGRRKPQAACPKRALRNEVGFGNR
jgi:hypothetical protein